MKRCTEIVRRVFRSMEADFSDSSKVIGGKESKAFYHWSIGIEASLVRAGFRVDEINSMPIAVLIQRTRENREHASLMAFIGSGQKRFTSPLSNPSDRVVMDFCKQKAGVN